jgi:hypothetical protein
MKNVHRHFLSSLIVVFACALLLGSGRSVAAVILQTFVFDHTPKSVVAPGSAGMSIGLIKPYYADEYKKSGNFDLLARYQKGLSGDVQELILAKGFTMKEPYDNLADMTYTDKKTTHLILDIRISPKFDTKNLRRVGKFTLNDKRTAYAFEGPISWGGRIELIAYEPMTHERLWSKSAELPSQSNIEVKTVNAYYDATDEDILGDSGFYNPIGQAMQQSYETVLNKIETYIDVEEFKALLPQIRELKSRK